MAAPLQLDRAAFASTFEVTAVKIPVKRTTEVMKRLAIELLSIPKMRRVEPCPGDDAFRLLLLKEGTAKDNLDALSEPARSFIASEGFDTMPYTVHIDYSFLSAEQVLKQLIGPLVGGADDVGGSFETVGHLAHLNLRDPLLPYKHVIGEVILDKNANLKTVVNKVGSIETEFRTFPMELLAGEDRTDVEVRESGCVFRFDFAKVYWNSRLQSEHNRLNKIILASGSPGRTVVCDMMAGVGPFALPLAKGGCTVYANDLNPHAAAALTENARRNRCEARLHTDNACARAFVRRLLTEGKVFHHAIMNLPASAIEFLDVFVGVDWEASGFAKPPLIHVYCFSKEADPAADALRRVNAVLGAGLTASEVAVHIVRDVAPKKPMMCLSFRAPSAAGAAAAPAAAATTAAAAAAAAAALPAAVAAAEAAADAPAAAQESQAQKRQRTQDADSSAPG